MNCRRTIARAFTLLEIMIAIALIGIAMLALLTLHHENLQSVIRGQNLTQAAMLAQGLMSQAETEAVPPLGKTQGDFAGIFPGQDLRNFRWNRRVEESPFPTVRVVTVSVLYGPGFRDQFQLTEFIHLVTQPAGGAATGSVVTGNSSGLWPKWR